MTPRPLVLAWFVAITLSLIAPTDARADWSSDPTTNFSIADAPGDQILPKLADGNETWVSWFDGIGTGYDVRIQLLGLFGEEYFAHNGILVADRGFSSVQDYGLDATGTDNAVLAFRDDRFGGTQITASLVSWEGNLVWGTNGVQLTNTSDFVASPKVAATRDGLIEEYVVAWTQNASARLQRLDENGVPQWPGDVVLTPAAGSYSVSDLRAAGDDVIVSIVHQTGGFGSPRHLLAQKYGASGAPLWGAGPLTIFDAGSLQTANFPTFLEDGTGGAVFSWYSVSPLQCFVQRVLANGTEAFAHNGLAVSTNTSRLRVSPAADFDPTTNAVFAFWEEQNSTQSQSGLYGQRIDAAGNRLAPEGIPIVPVSATQVTMVRTHAGTAGGYAYWCASAGFGQDRLYGAHLHETGEIDIDPFEISSTPSGKSRLVVEPTFPDSGPVRELGGFEETHVILAWSDDRVDGGDILGQPVDRGGNLIPGSWTGVAEVAPAETAWLAARPNPFRGATHIEYAVPGAAAFTLSIHDVTGRLVRSFPTSAPNGSIAWDGTDSAGTPVAAGVYFVRLGANGDGATRTLTVVR